MQSQSQIDPITCFQLSIVVNFQAEGVIHLLARIPTEKAVELLDHPEVPATTALYIFKMIEVLIEGKSKILNESEKTTELALKKILQRADKLKARGRTDLVSAIAEDLSFWQRKDLFTLN